VVENELFCWIRDAAVFMKNLGNSCIVETEARCEGYDRDIRIMRRPAQFIAILLCAAALVPGAHAEKTDRAALSAKIMRANSVFVDCVCPRGLAVAQETALQQLQGWGRFKVAQDHRHADLVFLFSGNPYLGDYVTRDGPDKRPVEIVSTIMNVIDPNTGESLWSDSRHWGSWRVKSATKDLIEELRQEMEGQTKRWTLNDILMCSVTPAYTGFVHLTAEEALAKSGSETGSVSGTADHLELSSSDAPDFCRSVQFIFNSDHRITGFEVPISQADDLEIGEVLQRPDTFDFTGGKYANDDQVYFIAQSKDKKIRIQFNVEGRRSLLSRVTYFY
jgi:hypothetical protein